MAETVFILGAGASAAMGTPLLADFFGVARTLASRSKNEMFRESLECFTRAHVLLQRTAAKTHIDLYNLESVWTCLEMAEVLGGLPDLDIGGVRKARESLEILIAQTLIGSMRVEWMQPLREGASDAGRASERRPCPQHYYQFLGRLRDQLRAGRVAFLTFNYDLGLDLALGCFGFGIDYALDGSARQSGIALLKLHGSLGWIDARDSIVPWNLPRETPWVLPSSTPQLPECSEWFQQHWQVCFGVVSGHRPFIVPPGDSKLNARHRLKAVWARAARELSEARQIVIIGFSLPPTDEFFRNLLGLGTISDALLERVVVVDPAEPSRTRLRDILSRQSQSRFVEIPERFNSNLLSEVEWRQVGSQIA